MRIKEHPILKFEKKKKLSFFFDGKKVLGYEGDTIASALHAIGVKVLSHSIELNRPRGFYCAIGNCSSCYMIVDGKPNVKTCVTLLLENMVVKKQVNKGYIYETN